MPASSRFRLTQILRFLARHADFAIALLITALGLFVFAYTVICSDDRA